MHPALRSRPLNRPVAGPPPWWAVCSATAAPLLLIGGWSIAAARQPTSYSSIRDTISALAGYAATDRWVMTVALAALGACHLVTAVGLRAAAPAGRVVLALGGVATVGVAVVPISADTTWSPGSSWSWAPAPGSGWPSVPPPAHRPAGRSWSW